VLIPRAANRSLAGFKSAADVAWLIGPYKAEGYFEENDLRAYSLNNLTAKPNLDGSFKIQFGGWQKVTPNCLPIISRSHYTVRL
jgi:hypothetical protein